MFSYSSYGSGNYMAGGVATTHHTPPGGGVASPVGMGVGGVPPSAYHTNGQVFSPVGVGGVSHLPASSPGQQLHQMTVPSTSTAAKRR